MIAVSISQTALFTTLLRCFTTATAGRNVVFMLTLNSVGKERKQLLPLLVVAYSDKMAEPIYWPLRSNAEAHSAFSRHRPRSKIGANYECSVFPAVVFLHPHMSSPRKAQEPHRRKKRIKTTVLLPSPASAISICNRRRWAHVYHAVPCSIDHYV